MYIYIYIYIYIHTYKIDNICIYGTYVYIHVDIYVYIYVLIWNPEFERSVLQVGALAAELEEMRLTAAASGGAEGGVSEEAMQQVCC